MALLAQPVERRAPEHDPVLGRRLCERRLDVAGSHSQAVGYVSTKYMAITSSTADTAISPRRTLRTLNRCESAVQEEHRRE